MEAIMKIFQIILLILISTSDITLFIWSYRLSQKVFLGQITSIYRQLGISILSSIPIGLLFIIMAMIIGIADNDYKWTINGIIGVTIISCGLIILGTIGAIWRFFIAGKFRSHIIKKIIDKYK
jgi:hypothetical protein